MHVLTVICRDGWMPGNLSEGWRRLGCTVEEFFHGSHMGKGWDPQGLRTNHETNRRLLDVATRLAGENRLDLIFCVIYDDVLEVGTIRQLRKLGVPIVNYHVDLVGQWYRVIRTGQYFDRIACAHEDHWNGLRRAGARPYYLPTAPTPWKRVNVRFALPGVVYLSFPWQYGGLSSGQRHTGFRCVYGSNWVQSRRTPRTRTTGEEPARSYYARPRVREEGIAGVWCVKARLGAHTAAPELDAALPAAAIQGRYAQPDFPAIVEGAAVNLGFTHFKGIPGTADERRQVRLREFEVPMAGGFYLTQDCPQLRGLYKIGEHLETWASVEDLSEKIRYYLARPDARAAIAARGRAHAVKFHTWAERFRGLLRELSITPPAAVPTGGASPQ